MEQTYISNSVKTENEDPTQRFRKLKIESIVNRYLHTTVNWERKKTVTHQENNKEKKKTPWDISNPLNRLVIKHYLNDRHLSFFVC